MNNTLGPYPLNRIIIGDARELANDIPDESIDLIFTDPPYPQEFQRVFYDMGEYAPRVLKPGGSLITLCGQYQVPLVIDALKALDFHWFCWLVNKGPKPTLFGVDVVCGGKPMIWFTKGKVRKFDGFFWDTQISGGSDKRFHAWGQSESWAYKNIDQLTKPGDVVLDPFVGGGTVPAVCKQLGRNYIGFEIDPTTAEIAKERVRNTQVPMFLMPDGQQKTLMEMVANNG